MDVKARLTAPAVAQLEAVIGRHDEPAIYGGPAGDPGLAGGPGSLSWEINGDLASLGIAGPGAILMEVLHPSVMAGVHSQSTYRTEPIKRIQNTLGYVLRTTFGNTEAATGVIEHVHRVHRHIEGVRPDGVPYRALDPELIAWVHTCIPWAVMTAYDRYRRPLSDAEKSRYLREQAVVGRMGGADRVPESLAELREFVHEMQPKLAVTQQTVEFIEFLTGRSGDYPTNAWDRADLWLNLTEAMSLMPTWARALTGTDHGGPMGRFVLASRGHLRSRLVHWLFPELACVALARARATADEHAVGDRVPVVSSGE
jgi:uncharacterized protein (DUF2236 family)